MIEGKTAEAPIEEPPLSLERYLCRWIAGVSALGVVIGFAAGRPEVAGTAGALTLLAAIVSRLARRVEGMERSKEGGGR